MRKITLLAFACLASGCASTRPHLNLGLPPLPSSASGFPERQAFYGNFCVSRLEGSQALVGGKLYDKTALLSLYQKFGAKEALVDLKTSKVSDLNSAIVPGATVGGGAVVGLVVGGIAWWFSGFYSVEAHSGSWGYISYSAPDRKSGMILPCLEWGSGIGAAAALVEYVLIRNNSARALRQSAQSYNQSLWRSLQLDAVPLPGGAKAGASVRF